MKRTLMAATALVLLAGGAAYAQSASNAGSNSNATVTTTSGSAATASPTVNVIGNPIGNGASSSTSGARAVSNTRSSSRSAAVGNQTTVTVENGSSGSGSSGSAGGDPTVHYSGGYTVRNTPEVIPPTVMGGNTCAVGASAGVAVAGFGLAGGATWADRACERRQQAALLYNMGEHQVALQLMCQDNDIRSAMRISGHPCSEDAAVSQAPAPAAPGVASVTAPAAPSHSASAKAPAAMAPAPAAAGPAAPAKAPATTLPAVTAAARPQPAWCSSASPSTEADRFYVAKMCGG